MGTGAVSECWQNATSTGWCLGMTPAGRPSWEVWNFFKIFFLLGVFGVWLCLCGQVYGDQRAVGGCLLPLSTNVRFTLVVCLGRRCFYLLCHLDNILIYEVSYFSLTWHPKKHKRWKFLCIDPSSRKLEVVIHTWAPSTQERRLKQGGSRSGRIR